MNFVCATCILRLNDILDAEKGTEDFKIAQTLRAGGKEARKRMLQNLGKSSKNVAASSNKLILILKRELNNTKRKLCNRNERIKHLEQ